MEMPYSYLLACQVGYDLLIVMCYLRPAFVSELSSGNSMTANHFVSVKGEDVLKRGLADDFGVGAMMYSVQHG